MIKYLRHIVYFAGFLLSFHLALHSYINSSFLEGLFNPLTSEQAVSLIFIAASVLTLIGIATADKPIRRFGLRRSTLAFSLITVALGLALGFATHTWLAVILFVLFYASGIALRFFLDVYLEDLSDNTSTGRIRGIALTLGNSAVLFAPFLASRLIQELYFGRAYIAAAIVLLPFIYLIAFPLRKIKEPVYEHASLLDGLKLLWCRDGVCQKDLRNSLLLMFTLYVFYAFMVIYFPLYLTKIVQLSWQDVGTVFLFMLLPFPLFQYLFGWLADKYFGEKEIMSMGLIIMAITTITMPFITTSSVLIWSVLMFVNRTGASALEVMNESYFFKNVDGHNISTISFYRTAGSLAYVLVPIFAGVIFTFASYKTLFILTGLLCFYALRYSLTLVDTK